VAAAALATFAIRIEAARTTAACTAFAYVAIRVKPAIAARAAFAFTKASAVRVETATSADGLAWREG
jgi:hypothetical protein